MSAESVPGMGSVIAEEVHVCGICGSVFSSSFALGVHIRDVHGLHGS